MAFPTVGSAVDTDFATSVTTMAVNLPGSISTGDLILAFVSVRNAGTWTLPSDWVELFVQAGGGSVGATSVFYKIADGTEGATATWTASTGTTGAWQTRLITDWHGTTPPEVGTATSGDGSNADPSNLVPSWGIEDTVWFGIAGHSAGSTAAWSAGPLHYSDFASNGASSGGAACCVATAYRAAGETSENPQEFTASNSNRWWAANTLAVRPAAVADSVETLRPDADGSQTGWNDEGGTYDKVDDTTPDDDSGYLYAGATTTRTFTFPTSSLSDETINAVRVYARVKGVDPVESAYTIMVRIDSTNYDSDTRYSNKVQDYITQVYEWTQNPDTSSAWTVDDINALEAGVTRGTGGGQRLTQFYVEVLYEEGGGGGGATYPGYQAPFGWF